MIEPIAPREIFYQEPIRCGTFKCSNFCASTLSSLNPINWLQRILHWIKGLFCFREKPHFSGPEIDPTTLGARDPFFQKMFLSKSGKLSPRDPVSYGKIQELFEILGSGGYLSWMRHSVTLYRLKRELKDLKPPTLVFLYQILQNKPMTESVVNFHKNARTADWNDFIKNQVRGLEIAKDLDQLLPGFCKALGIDLKIPKKLIQEQKWEAFILHIFEERKKHFNIK